MAAARGWGAAAVGAVALLALAGCGGSEQSQPAPTPTLPSVTPVPSGYPSGATTGLDYAKPGDEVALGAAATVAWQPPQATVVGALRITVTSIQRTTFAASFKDWKVSDQVKGDAPYFVRATIANSGAVDLGGRAVPLYGETSADTLLEPSTFASTFKPCNPNAFPKSFPAGKVATVCLVYLVPDQGELTGVSFRPTESFVPITWGAVSQTMAETPTPSATMTP